MSSIADENDTAPGPGRERILLAELPKSASGSLSVRVEGEQHAPAWDTEGKSETHWRISLASSQNSAKEAMSLSMSPAACHASVLSLTSVSGYVGDGFGQREVNERAPRGRATHDDGDDVEELSASAGVGDKTTVLTHEGAESGSGLIAVEVVKEAGVGGRKELARDL